MGLFSKLFRSKIIISSDPIEEQPKTDYTASAYENEERICQYFIDNLSGKKDVNKFTIEHRSQDYTSLIYGNNDFMRVKFTHASKWISFSLSENDRHKYETEPLFNLTPKKTSIHWKASVNSYDDLSKFLKIAENACYELKVAGSAPPTEAEKIVCDYIKELLLAMGANEKYVTYHHYTSYAKTEYCGHDIFKFKILKSKKNYAMMEDSIAKKAKLKLDERQRLVFTSVDDLKSTPELTTYVKLQLERFKDLENYYDNKSI